MMIEVNCTRGTLCVGRCAWVGGCACGLAMWGGGGVGIRDTRKTRLKQG